MTCTVRLFDLLLHALNVMLMENTRERARMREKKITVNVDIISILKLCIFRYVYAQICNCSICVFAC